MMTHLVTFTIVNLLAIFFFYLMVKNYRQLTALLKQHDFNKAKDLFAFAFINIVFQQFPEQPEISNIQRKVVKNAVYAGLLLLIGRYLYVMQFA